VVAPLAEASNAFVSIADHVTPAVVSIQTERGLHEQQQRRPRGQQQIPPGLEDFFDQFDQGRRSQPVEGSGSGFIVSPDGYILTNNHVVADADRVNVTLLDKRVFKAKIIGRDPNTDVAVVKIDGSNFPTVPLGNDAASRVGEWVLAVGNPLGLDFTVTAGIISAKGRSDELRGLASSQYAIQDFIQTDAAINPGNSGGPLVNIRGEVIGINSAIASQTGFYSGYGFAIPITLAKSVMDDILKYGKVRRAVLGVAIQQVTPEAAQSAGLKEVRGALVGGFTGDDSPAEKAGVEPGDIIVAVNGKPVDRVVTLQRTVRDLKPGETIDLQVMRYGTPKTFKVKLIEAPSDDQVASADGQRDGGGTDKPATYDKLGVTVEPVTPEIASQAQLSDQQRGLLVTDVDVGGPAYRNLSRGTVIVKVLHPGPARPVRSVSDLESALSKGKNGDVVSLLVVPPGSKQTAVVNLRIGG
jgi:serine protease Do